LKLGLRENLVGNLLADFREVDQGFRTLDRSVREQIATWDSGKGNVEHIHPNCEEIVFVIQGEVEHTLGDQRTALQAGDLIIIPRNTPHRVFNAHAATAKTFIVFSSPDRQFVPIEPPP
jgi:quercetin dioxygenase-like cupin family protein